MYIRGFAYIYRNSFSVVLFGISFLVKASKRLATGQADPHEASAPTELIFLYRGSKLGTFENQNRNDLKSF